MNKNIFLPGVKIRINGKLSGYIISGKFPLLLSFLILILVISSIPAQATGAPTKLIVFTDKSVYLLGEPYDITGGSKPGAVWSTSLVTGIDVKVYAAILDDDGNMIRSLSGLSMNVTLKDNARYYHNGSTTSHSQTQVSNGNWWNSVSTSFTDPDGDGVWEATFNLQDAEQKNIAQAASRADQFNITVIVNETTRGLSSTTYVLFSRNGCGHGDKNIGGLTAGEIHNKNSAHTQVACTVCHWGWEHKMGVHGNNTALGNDVATKPTISNANGEVWNYNTGTEDGTASGNFKNSGRADICVACHNSNKNYVNILDMDSGTASLITDANNDGINDNDRPSCSWSQGATSEGDWTSPGCHDNGAGNITGTLIEKVPLMNSTTYFYNWNWKQNGTGKSYGHNRSGLKVACELCHGNHEVKGFPNASASKTNINEQCWYCHNITGGLNITSNGGNNVDHSSTNCKSCHSKDEKLNVHLVPQGAGTDCMSSSCHQIDQNGNPAINTTLFGRHKNVNTTNGTGILDNNDCKTCHYDTTDMTNVQTYSCDYCHNSGNFSTPIIKNHKPNGVNISTPAYCSVCHNNSISMFALNSNASVSHYTTNTSLIDSTNCVICHKNNTNGTKWSGATDPKNSSAFPHTINSSTKQDCYACHANVSASTFHNISLQKPLNTTVKCIDCHTTNRTMALKKIDEAVFTTGVHKNRACTNCHTNATMFNMNNTYKFVNDPAKNCTNCHIAPVQFAAPAVAEHNQLGQDVITAANCTLCHQNGGMYLPNIGTNGTNTSITHYLKDVTNMSTTPYQHNGTINTSNCITCHNNATYSGNVSWGSPQNISTTHNAALMDKCDKCHKDNNIESLGSVDFHNASVQKPTDESCINCHAQPPSGVVQPNMTGAHDLHKSKGYGIEANTSCNYCHSTEGGNEPYHPNSYDNANVTTNASASMTHIQNLSSGNDDTCSGVSCHTNGISPSARLGTATWNTATAGSCNVCHSTVTSGLPPTGNHTKHYTTEGYTCAECHGTNADSGTQSTHKNNSQIDIIFTNVTGSINTSTKECGVYCHSPNSYDVKPKPIWGTSNVACGDCHSLPPATTRSNATHSLDTNCDGCHGTGAITGTQAGHIDGSITTEGMTCISCHSTYGNAVNLSKHNQTNNPSAPGCTTCHIGYLPVNAHTSGNRSYIVTENNTCRNCHIDNVNGFKEAHTSSSSDCTMCHFANTTKKFSLNQSLYSHDHNLSVEHSYYEYVNGGGMPLASNNGTGFGMFPQYTCSLTCHAVRNPEKVDKASSTWLNSSHANSRFAASDSNNNCAKCKSPLNYNDTLTATNPVIAIEDWEGIQCRVCHNLHNRSYSGISGYPVAFYNATASSYVNYSVYDKVSNNTELCEKCHAPGGSHDSKFAGTHKSTLNFTCTSCHMNASFNRGMHDFQVRNMNTTTVGCESCHAPANHTFQFTSQHTAKVECVACHDQTFTTKNATGYAVSSDNYFGLWKETPTSKWTTAKKMLTTTTTWPLHNLSRSVNCDKCHGTLSVYNGTIAPSFENGTGCIACHSSNVDTANFGIHQNNNKTDGGLNDSDCVTCHFDISGMGTGYIAQPGINVYECADCHTGTGQYQAPLVKEHNQNGTDVITSATCTICHSNGGMYNENTGANGTTTAISHYIKDVTDMSTSPYLHNVTIDTSNCILCHNGAYTNNASWGSPVNISTSTKRIHTETLTSQCDTCHKDATVTSLALVDFHNASLGTGDIENCLSCHDLNGSSLKKIDTSSIGMHININNSDGGISNDDCWTCHFNTSGMGSGYQSQVGVNVYACNNCHVNQVVSSPAVNKHYQGSSINVTTMECQDCHINSVNTPDPASSVNTTIGNVMHYGTTTNLVKPTAGTYNVACNICHNSVTNMTLYGVQNKQTTLGHTSTATCNKCHVNSTSSADTLHNVSLEMPLTTNCQTCHTTYADKYGAPNITGTLMLKGNCNPCHGGDITGSLDTLARHNVDRNYNFGTAGQTNTVYLNNQQPVLTITKGGLVTITSQINDYFAANTASRVAGAEYYIDVDPGQGNGTPMAATDGYYNAVNGNWEDIIATLDTSTLSGGNHTIFVRGIDIGKHWSATKNATLIVQAMGYINGTVTNSTSAPVIGAYISTVNANFTIGSNGTYSLMVPEGTYTVNAIKRPEFNDYSVNNINVTPLNTTTVVIVMDQKPTGTISGIVSNV